MPSSMHLVLLAASFGSLAVAKCPELSCKGGEYATAASGLKDYAPASSYCSYEFPAVCIVTAHKTLPPVSLETLTTIVTVDSFYGNGTYTASFPKTTSTPDDNGQDDDVDNDDDDKKSSSSAKASSSISVHLHEHRRRAASSKSQASRLSSLQKQDSTFIAAVCTCLEKDASSTSTVTATGPRSTVANVTRTVWTTVGVNGTGVAFPTGTGGAKRM